MAIRGILKDGDEQLRKKSRPVEIIDDRVKSLVKDMTDTLIFFDNGVGLAAPQVGILKRIIVINVGESPFEIINPEVLETQGRVVNVEGCLSVPGKFGEVERPQKVTVKGLNKNGEEIIISGENLLARVLCHEIDHLDGVLFIDKVIKFVESEEK